MVKVEEMPSSTEKVRKGKRKVQMLDAGLVEERRIQEMEKEDTQKQEDR